MTTIPQDEGMIEVQNLRKRYAKAQQNAVDDVSFTVRRGEIFGLLGPNGAGKTTTISILTAGALPDSGTARLAGIDVVANPIGVKQRIAVVPQRPNLDQSLKVHEILTFHAAYHGVPRRERNARADYLLDELGLKQRKRGSIQSYSGGMAQRVMLARALMHEPLVLFLDEPTNNLDPQTRLFLWERIRALHEQGVTVVLTTHDMEEADQLCERIAIMDQGRILVLNTPAELKKLIPGGTMLELRVYTPETVATGKAHSLGEQATRHTSRIQEALVRLPGVMKVEQVPASPDEQGQQESALFRLYAEEAGTLAGAAMSCILAEGAELRDLHLTRPGLEDVFIYLTGRNLRS